MGPVLALGRLWVCPHQCQCRDEEDKEQTSYRFNFVKRLLGLNKYDVIQESRLIFVDKEIEAGNEAKITLSYGPVFNRTHMYMYMNTHTRNTVLPESGSEPEPQNVQAVHCSRAPSDRVHVLRDAEIKRVK